MAMINGLTCNPSCTLSQASNLSGTATIGGNPYAMSFSTNPGSFSPDNIFNVDTGVDTSGIGFTANGTIYDIYQEDQPGSAGVEPAVVLFNGGGSTGTLLYGNEATPAPVPGAGLLSYLLLGFAGLMFGLKRLGWKTRTAIDRAISASLFPKRAIANA